MRMTRGVPIVLMFLAALATCGVGRTAETVEDLRLVASAPTHLQVNWQGQAQAYRIVYSEAVEARQHITSVVAQGPFTLVGLVPETEYIIRVEALQLQPTQASPAQYRVIGKSETVQIATGPWEPREWENLRLWPSRHVDTFPGDTTYPAIAAYKNELLVVECYEGAIYVSQVNPETLEVHSTKLLFPAEEDLVRTYLDAVVIQDTLWVSWLQADWNGHHVPVPMQQLVSYDLQTSSVSDSVKLGETQSCGLVSYNGQVWLSQIHRRIGAYGGRRSMILAHYDPVTGLQNPKGWVRSPSARPMYATAAVDLGIEVLLAFLQRATGADVANQRTLWAVKFNGQEFYEERMLRGRGEYSSPTGAAVNDTIVLAYAKATQEELSDIDLTLTSAEGGEVTSTSYIHDGTYNTTPDAVAIGDSIYLVYNKWSARAGSPNAVNYGTFIGKIELKF